MVPLANALTDLAVPAGTLNLLAALLHSVHQVELGVLPPPDMLAAQPKKPEE